jgi:Tfp pilus assembly protein PilN
MRAVNLLPSDLRGAAPKPVRAARPEPAEGIGAYVVLGVLALCVAALAGFVLTNNGLKQRQADLASAKQHGAAATAKAAALKPYADFESTARARVETVRGLAAARFDWQQALGDLSRAVPSDVRLQALNGDMGLPGAAAAASDPLRGAIAAPAITMVGCTSSQRDVARMMSRLKSVDGVTRVSLSKSERPASAAGIGAVSPCGKGSPPSFSVVVFFERSAALAAFAPVAGATAAVPSAVNGAKAAGASSGGAAAPDDTGATGKPGTDASGSTPQASTGTSTPTSTTTGGTP